MILRVEDEDAGDADDLEACTLGELGKTFGLDLRREPGRQRTRSDVLRTNGAVRRTSFSKT